MESIFDIIRIPIAWILKLCHSICPNYMVALLLFALVMQILLLPFAIKQQKNSVKQAKLAPKLAAISKKYAGRTDRATQQKMQQEQMDLYQRENYNMMGGCLPLLIQMPILFALYRVITQPLRYLCGLSTASVNTILTKLSELGVDTTAGYPQITAINKLRDMGAAEAASITEGIENFNFDSLPVFKMFGDKIDLAIAPKDGGWWMLLIPIVTIVALIISQMITKKFTYQPPNAGDANNNLVMKVFMYAGMPLLSGWIAYQYAAALGIYWIFRNLLSLVQQIVLSKAIPIPHFTEEDYKAAEKEMYGSSRAKKNARALDPNRERPRSLHHIDDDDDDTYDDGGRVTRYDDEDDDTSASVPKSVPSSAVEAPIKDDKNKTYKKKKK